MSNKNLFLISFAAFLVTMGGMLWTEAQAGCGKVIIPLELDPNIAAFKQRIATCDISWIAANTKLDFVFLLAYSATLYFGWRGISGKAQNIAWLTLLPGVFDAIENIHLLDFLYLSEQEVSSSAYNTYYWCVRIKFFILVAVLVGLLAFVVKWFGQRNKQTA